MVGTVAGTIQGEAGSNPANQFAVASVIYNRMQTQGFPSDAYSVVNAPSQFTGYSANPNQSAQQFADAIQNGTLGQYGNTGNALYFQTAGSDTTLGSRSPGVINIGGNNYSDQWGSPSSDFQAPAYGDTSGNSSSGTPSEFSFSQAGTDPSGNPLSTSQFTDQQNLTNYGYFGQQPVTGAVSEPSGATDTSILNQNPYAALGGDYSQQPIVSQVSTNDGMTSVLNPIDNSSDLPNTNAGNYGTFGLPTDAGNSLVTGAASALSNTNAGNWWNILLSDAWDYTMRFGLVILGVVLIAGAAWALSREGTENAIAKAMR